MYEQLRNDFLMALSNVQEISMETTLQSLDQAIMKYEVKLKDADLVCCNGELPEMVQTYLVCKKMSGLTEGTLNNYKIILNVFFKEVKVEPQFITANEIRKFLYMYQEQKGISRRTIDKYREYIARFFTWAHNEGYIQSNPARNVTAIKYEEKPREALTQVELEYLRMALERL